MMVIMSEKLDKLRQLAQRLKDRVHLPIMSANGKEKVDQLLTKYIPAQKVNEIAEKFKRETVGKKLKELVSKYEKFTGVAEIMALQNSVIDAQERFLSSQERRRSLGRQVADIEARLKELHSEMQNTMKGDDKYLHLCTEEHKLIIQERALRQLFSEAEREEREQFATMSAAVKLGHERERAHAERNKYWYIVASIFGTVLGIAGSTINNHLKMAEFRDMMEQQMARSASVLYAVAGRGATDRQDVTDAMRTEFAYQEQLAQNMKLMQENINHLVSKQSSLIDHLNHREHVIETQMKDLKRIIIAASQASAKSEEELAKVLTAVHHEIDESERDRGDREIRERDLSRTQPTSLKTDNSLESNQVLTGLGIFIFAAVIFGSIVGRVS